MLTPLSFDSLVEPFALEEDALFSNEPSPSTSSAGFPSVQDTAEPSTLSVAAPPRGPLDSVGRESRSRKRSHSPKATACSLPQSATLSDAASSSSLPTPHRKSRSGRKRRVDSREQEDMVLQVLDHMTTLLTSIVKPLNLSIFQEQSVGASPVSLQEKKIDELARTQPLNDVTPPKPLMQPQTKLLHTPSVVEPSEAKAAVKSQLRPLFKLLPPFPYGRNFRPGLTEVVNPNSQARSMLGERLGRCSIKVPGHIGRTAFLNASLQCSLRPSGGHLRSPDHSTTPTVSLIQPQNKGRGSRHLHGGLEQVELYLPVSTTSNSSCPEGDPDSRNLQGQSAQP